MVVDGATSGLDDKDVLVAYRLADCDGCLLVGKLHDGNLGYLQADARPHERKGFNRNHTAWQPFRPASGGCCLFKCQSCSGPWASFAYRQKS